MKKLLFLTLIIGIISFQSCKKDNELTKPNDSKQKTETSAFNPDNIEDMNEYLHSFIKNFKSATKENDVLLPLEEAEWHLTDCLNYQHCNANTSRLNMVYDTITTYIAVNNNEISMSDIGNSFTEISQNVRNIYDSYDFENKQIVYIYSVIDKDNNTRGESAIRTVIATANNDGHFYFDEWNYLCLDSIFPYSNQYHWRNAADSLKKYVKHFGINGNVSYYVSINTKRYNFRNLLHYINPAIVLQCGIYNNRLFVSGNSLSEGTYINGGSMAFYLDSYLGLVKDERLMSGKFMDAFVQCFVEENKSSLEPPHELLYHDLVGVWGTVIVNGGGSNPSR